MWPWSTMILWPFRTIDNEILSPCLLLTLTHCNHYHGYHNTNTLVLATTRSFLQLMTGSAPVEHCWPVTHTALISTMINYHWTMSSVPLITAQPGHPLHYHCLISPVSWPQWWYPGVSPVILETVILGEEVKLWRFYFRRRGASILYPVAPTINIIIMILWCLFMMLLLTFHLTSPDSWHIQKSSWILGQNWKIWFFIFIRFNAHKECVLHSYQYIYTHSIVMVIIKEMLKLIININGLQIGFVQSSAV